MNLLGNESEAYRKLREELREAEIALKLQREAVAELRRRLPLDTPVEVEHRFREGPKDLAAGDAPLRDLNLAGLFRDPAKPLVLVHFMYGKKQSEPCPMCTMWADGYDGALPHLQQHVNFAVCIAGELAPFRAYARERGWRNLRVVQSQDGFKRELGFEADDGVQMPGVSVFTLGGDGRPRHFYSGGALQAEGQFRGMDLLSPVWNFLDLTPAGRGDWFPQRRYPA